MEFNMIVWKSSNHVVPCLLHHRDNGYYQNRNFSDNITWNRNLLKSAPSFSYITFALCTSNSFFLTLNIVSLSPFLNFSLYILSLNMFYYIFILYQKTASNHHLIFQGYPTLTTKSEIKSSIFDLILLYGHFTTSSSYTLWFWSWFIWTILPLNLLKMLVFGYVSMWVSISTSWIHSQNFH